MKNIIYLILFTSSLISDGDILIKKYSTMRMKFPFVGIVETSMNQFVAQGFYKEVEKVDAESWIASPFIDEETGIIIIDGTDNIMSYDVEKKEYWTESLEEYFNKSDSISSTENKTEEGDTDSLSNTWKDPLIGGFISSTSAVEIKREQENEIINLNGFQTKKWITTVLDSTDNPVMIFEEWFLDTLPLVVIFDSLKTDLFDRLNPNKEINQENSGAFFSSNYFVESLDKNNSLVPLDGYPIKFSMHLYEDVKEIVSMSFEIKELYAISFDASYFTVPEKYKRINKTNKP